LRKTLRQRATAKMPKGCSVPPMRSLQRIHKSKQRIGYVSKSYR
jgi:hypothetical protein